MNKIDQLSNSQLYKLCREYGTNALRWRWKFVGLLPEVKRRRLYEKRGFHSIYEFAARLAGVSKEQVDRVVNLDNRLSGLQILRQMLVEGGVSFNKLERIATIATSENEKDVEATVRGLSKPAIETLLRDIRFENQKNSEAYDSKSENENVLIKRQNEVKHVPGHVNKLFVQANENENHGDTRSGELQLSADTTDELLEMKRKGFDLDAELKEFLKRRREEIEAEKQEVTLELESRHDAAIIAGRPVGRRYIPQAVRRVVEKEFGKACAIPGCMKPVAELHHTARFALSRNHDTHYLAPLCKGHNELAHSVDVRVREKRTEEVAMQKIPPRACKSP